MDRNGASQPGDSKGGVPERALAVLHRAEDAALALLLTSMIVLAPLQIALRIFFDSAISWGDPALRALVLWVGLLGALAATRGNRHITIDVVSQFLPARINAAVRALTSAFAVGVCGVVAYHGWRFVSEEREFESIAFAEIPAWTIEAVIPFAFGLMALRFAIGGLAAVRDAVVGPADEPQAAAQ